MMNDEGNKTDRLKIILVLYEGVNLIISSLFIRRLTVWHYLHIINAEDFRVSRILAKSERGKARNPCIRQ